MVLRGEIRKECIDPFLCEIEGTLIFIITTFYVKSFLREIIAKNHFYPPFSYSGRKEGRALLRPPTTSYDRLRPPITSCDLLRHTTSYHLLRPPTIAHDILQPLTTAYNRLTSYDLPRHPITSNLLRPPTIAYNLLRPPTTAHNWQV